MRQGLNPTSGGVSKPWTWRYCQEEGRALDGPQLAADADREQVVDHGFADVGVRGIAVVVAGIETLGEPRCGEQLLGLARVV
jgi:hypothetical protein